MRMYYAHDPLESSISKLDYLLGKRVEIIAFGISYIGKLDAIDYEQGTLKISDENDSAILDLERVESFGLVS